MGRSYVISDRLAAVSTAKSLCVLTCGANKVLQIHSARFTSTTNGDEVLDIQCERITNIGSAAGGTPSVGKVEAGDAAHSFTPLSDLTTEPTTYGNPVMAGADHESGGWTSDRIPEFWTTVSGQTSIGWRLKTAPSAAHTIYYEVLVTELG